MLNEEFVTYFIKNYLWDLMYDSLELPNISFNFKEDEAKKYLNNIIINNMDYMFNKMNMIYDGLNKINYNKPVMEISNYKLFFNSLDNLIKSLHNIYKNECFVSNDDTIYTFQSLPKYIWLRMTPDNFKNPEKFLLKNIEMINNNTFNEYYNDIGLLFNIDDYYRIRFRNKLAHTYDEENKELLFYIESKYSERYYLPIIRYGIYKSNNKSICEIGSIQKKYKSADNDLEIINIFRNNINMDVPRYYKKNIEPNKLISLLLFIKLLQDKNINIISIPSMYVLDYEYHQKRDKVLIDMFNSRWSKYNINLDPEGYKKGLILHNKDIGKVDLISENKTTSFIRLFERLIYQIPNIEILEYPNELSSYMTIKIPENTINNNLIKKLIK